MNVLLSSMYNIYKITDINGLCYVGSTKQDILHRLANHCCEKKKGTNKNCKCKLLNLDDCEIEVIEECTFEESKLRLQYWIDTLDCVN